MKHLLSTRFQGALIGGNLIYLTPHQIAPNRLMQESKSALANGINSLIYRGKYIDRDWEQNVFSKRPTAELAIVAMLPLMLFFHDDRIKLREILISVSHGWELDWETCSSAVAIGYIISRSLTESFDASTIVAQLLDEAINLHPLLFQSLRTIDRQLNQFDSLYKFTHPSLSIPHPIVSATVLAIYCLLCAPEDLSLALRLAYQIDDRTHLTCALTGILSGAQNSIAGIPLNGYLATQDRQQWLRTADNLLATWAGVDRLSFDRDSHPLAVAAPKVIQPRS
ncbi:ADP-ribosylglycohydrolase family protein [Chamaesiphon sp. VAR_69_metabat_338]|uniref:ADP-ribosylglycohydrolase family protein n=1 Tax=Chamaesiphon sp. VAR_69_metabat_338 TaxID=2964704 RepID=UPI00286D9D5D|nr:ADP-ribosylglycohydrolase family protein [Chamaesiphon sp. VAR_69_metabat_338]